MRTFPRFILSLFALLAGMAFGSAAEADVTTFSFSGTFTGGDSANIFGLQGQSNISTPFSGTLTLTSNAFPPGNFFTGTNSGGSYSEWNNQNDTGNSSISLTINGQTLSQATNDSLIRQTGYSSGSEVDFTFESEPGCGNCQVGLYLTADSPFFTYNGASSSPDLSFGSTIANSNAYLVVNDCADQTTGCNSGVDNFGASITSFSASSSADTSVPEPASLAILGTGLGGLGWLRRRARKAA